MARRKHRITIAHRGSHNQTSRVKRGTLSAAGAISTMFSSMRVATARAAPLFVAYIGEEL